ncbi:hypothetical protein [Leucobacter sp. M11]|uniref:hypothetical protein n=1 Tax=Leucobacter sp. M11 TaxID=2993565 RepID=UPI002D7E6E7C|nr:hypothetical protein [Leucobacter sp. M11]MEB4616033.1 hypothetical protein [Leucobacter sp. M11]
MTRRPAPQLPGSVWSSAVRPAAVRRTAPRRVLTLLALPLAAALALSGCAPEPGSADGSGTPAGVDGGTAPESVQPPVEGETKPEIGPEPTKTAELPASFPTDLVPLAADAVIDDAGERGAGLWFAVLRYPDAAAANAALDALIEAGGFAVLSDESGLPGERTAQLETAQVQVSALIAPSEESESSGAESPGAEGAVLLSLDITALT